MMTKKMTRAELVLQVEHLLHWVRLTCDLHRKDYYLVDVNLSTFLSEVLLHLQHQDHSTPNH